MRVVACVLLAALACAAQKVYVYSPLTRVGPSGEVVKPDRGSAAPRHILSPGVPRNGYSSLRVVVEMDKPEPYFLDIGQNPENAVKATLYRESFIETPAGLIPDTLTKVELPYRGFPTDFRLPGQRVVTFWLDMWVDKNAPVDRVKVEPQLYVESLKDWIIYPMEVRIQEPVLPAAPASLPALPDPSAPADTAVWDAVCASAKTGKPEAGQPTARQFLQRNAAAQMALSGSKEALFKKILGADLKTWCAKPSTPPTGPEWYLRLRDAVYRQAGAE